MSRRPITLRLDPRLAATLEKRAEQEDRTMTAIVERALRLYFQRPAKEQV